MKNIKINGKNLLGYSKKEVIKQIQLYSKIDKEMVLCYDDISNVYYLFTLEGWSIYHKFSFIYKIKQLNCENYNNLSLKVVEKLIFN